ncbi:MAG: Lrp/AsnC family transcriptional regulator [Hyphomonadaceae bacterium]
MTKNAIASKYVLDDFDRALLRLVQRDNQQTYLALGQQVGLSESAVRRRLKALRKSKIIIQDVSLLKPDKYSITLIVQVSFLKDTKKIYADFDQQMDALINVRQSYHVSGSTDYILVVQGPNLEWYEEWAKDNLMTNQNISRHETAVVWSCKKYETEVLV